MRSTYFFLCLITVLLACLGAPNQLFGQIQTYEAQVQGAIQDAGISETEFRLALEKIGIDYSRLDQLTPLQVRAVQATMIELRNEKAKMAISTMDTLEQITLDSISLDSMSTMSSSPDSVKSARIFGHQLFFNNAIDIIPFGSSFVPTDDYILDAGDQLSISIFSSAVIDQSYSINSDGTIQLFSDGRSIGRIQLAGLTVSEARNKILRSFANRFSPSQISVQLKSIRTIRVQIRGEVFRPGDYTVSAINSAVNIIGAAGGITDNGSVRNITVIHSDGTIEVVDLYSLIDLERKPKVVWLRSGDIIIVPTASHLVKITGSIARTHVYEMRPHEGIKDLVKVAGGLATDAYKKSFQLTRIEDDKKSLRDIPYAALLREGGDFLLSHGDSIVVSAVRDIIENSVIIKGEVRREGEYELSAQMTLKDLVVLGGLTQYSRRDFANLKRREKSGATNMIAISIDNALNGVLPEGGLLLQSGDEVLIWSSDRFVDQKEVKVDGAVRYPEAISYDEGGNLRVVDLIEYAGGLRRDAANFAHVIRIDPLKPNERMYIRVDLVRAFENKTAADNFILEPFDSLYVYSKNDFIEEAVITVDGAVINPGIFPYGEGLTLKDVLILAGGFKRSSATNNIEVSRIQIKDNQPTQTIVQRIALDRKSLYEDGIDEEASSFIIEPFDQIFVRYVPEFGLQSTIFIEGEVRNPGPYAIVTPNERVFDVIKRSGGLTEKAFAAGSTFYRVQDSLGFVLLELEEIMSNPDSKFNYVLADGDKITIPKLKEFVTIVGATQYLAQNPEQKSITVPYYKGKSANYYINSHAGGYADNARRDKIFVLYPNGGVAATVKKFPFGKVHPDVLPGSTIQIGFDKEKDNSGEKDGNLNLTKVLGDSVAQAMSILTLILLIQRLD